MTELGIPDPLVLEGDVSKNYKIFANSFNTYIKTMGFEDEKTKVALFYSTIGKNARELCKTFDLAPNPTLMEIMDRFQLFCKSYKNSNVYYAYKFYKRQQHQNETFGAFLQNIYMMADKCNFKCDRETLIRDKVIFGLKNKAIRKEIFIRGYSNLKDIVHFLMASEANAPAVVNPFHSVKIEKVSEDEQMSNPKEISNNKGETVSSSQELRASEDNTVFGDVMSGLDDRICTSTSVNNLNGSLIGIKRENKRPLSPETYKNSFCENREKSLRLDDQAAGTDSSFDVVILDSSDGEFEQKENQRYNISEKPLKDKNDIMTDLKRTLRNRKPRLSTNGDRKFNCGKCEKSFEEIAELEIHMKICFCSPLNNAEDTRVPASEKVFENGNNEDKKKTRENQRKNEDSAQEKKKGYTCSKCSMNFIYPSRLKEHEVYCLKNIQKKVTKQTMYSCNICTMKFRLKVHFIRHLRKHAQTSNKANLSENKPKPLKSKIHKCHICDRIFKYKRHFSRHLTTVHANDPKARANPSNEVPNVKIVPEVNEQLTVMNRVIVESRAKEEKKTYACEMCSEKFEEEEKLEAHKLTHRKNDEVAKPSPPTTEVLNFKCLVCFEKFSERDQLFTHLLTH